jgi:hypothetical protein
MAKNDSLIKEANSIVPALRDEANDLEHLSIQDPFFSLKDALFNFFENMLRKVQEEDSFMLRVKEAILEKIDLGEITIAQLMGLMSNLNSDKQYLVDSMLSIFKPTPGTGEISPLINPKISRESGDVTPFSDLSAQEKSVLDKLSRIMEESEKE